MSRRHSAWEDAVVWHTVNTQADGVQQLNNEVFELRRALNQERSDRQQETAQLRQELKEATAQIKLMVTYMANQGQIFAAFADIESKKDD